MSEQNLVRTILSYLKLRNIPAWRQNQGAMTLENKGQRRFIRFASAPCISDIIGLIPPTGRLLAIECKIGNNSPTPTQADFLATIADAGGLAIVARSLDDVIEALGDEQPTKE